MAHGCEHKRPDIYYTCLNLSTHTASIFRQVKVFSNFSSCLCWRKFYPTKYFPCTIIWMQLIYLYSIIDEIKSGEIFLQYMSASLLWRKLSPAKYMYMYIRYTVLQQPWVHVCGMGDISIISNPGGKDCTKCPLCGEYCEFFALIREILRNRSVIHSMVMAITPPTRLKRACKKCEKETLVAF